MPLEELSSDAALRNLRSRTAIWPERGKNNRIGLVPWPELKPSFQFQDDDLFFCLGSCFAQHVGAVLARTGFSVATHQPNPHAEGDWAGSNHLIRYNVCSMLNEFRWALDPSTPFSHEVYAAEENGLVMDPFGHSQWAPHTLEKQKSLREFTLSVTRGLAQCRVVIVTLGLVEVWYDRKTDLYANMQPSRFALRQEPDRYVLRVLDYQDILNGLEEMHRLLRRFGHADFRMLLTTSPVPLHATFRGKDVLIANNYSKSVQRAAAEAFVARHENVDYFPSFEAITLGNADVVWKDDQRHVTDVAVSSIMEHVVNNYAPNKKVRPENMFALQNLSQQWASVGGMKVLGQARALALRVQELEAQLASLTVAKV